MVADVSGKGVAAAFFMAVTRTMLRGVALAGSTPADCITRVNEALCRENPIDMFVTVLYAELEESERARCASSMPATASRSSCAPAARRDCSSAPEIRRLA